MNCIVYLQKEITQNIIMIVKSFSCRSADFRPCYGRLNELRAFLPPGVPMLASTATVTDIMRKDVIKKLDMDGCKIVFVSPNKPNIFLFCIKAFLY